MLILPLRHNEGTFYVTTTLVLDGGPTITNPARWNNVIIFTSIEFYSYKHNLQVIFTNDDIWANEGNGWSDPIHFNFSGYDTSLFWDDDGKVYVQGSHYWRIFPAIQQFEIDLHTGASLSGDPVTLWNGTGGLV